MAKITDWFANLFTSKNNNRISTDMHCGELTSEIYYKQLAIQSSINLIANTVARSEFLTFDKGKETRQENYYRLNVEPNQNKTSSKFWREVIRNLIYDNECLVIRQNGMFYVADEFDVDEFAFKENEYTNVMIGDYKLRDVFKESQIFHFEYHDEEIKKVIDGLYNIYGKLIKAGTDNYKKNNARRGALKVPMNYPQTDEAAKDLEALLGERFKRFFEAEGGAVLPLTNGLEYEELISNIGAKTSSIEGRDTRAFVDDVFDFTAIAFQIPPSLLKGNTVDTKDAFANFLTFCINPIAELISDELNRKMYGKKLFLEKSYCKLDTTRIKNVDIKDIASSLDVLLRTGLYTINDCLKQLGKEELSSEIGEQRFITKNYAPIEEVMKGDADNKVNTLKGGD